MTEASHGRNEGSLSAQLEELFDAERTARRVHAAIVKISGAGSVHVDEVVRGLRLAAEEAGVGQSSPAGRESEQGDEEHALRLVRIAALLGDLHGASTVDLLIDILSSEEPEARHAAGEALENLAFDRFKEVALGVERALVRLPVGSAALTELPYLLAEVPEPGATKLLGEFLKHRDAEAVAAAIEALAEVGDPSAAPLLVPLMKDKRVVQLEDEDGGEDSRVTLGELASEARDLLADIGSAGEPRPAPGGRR